MNKPDTGVTQKEKDYLFRQFQNIHSDLVTHLTRDELFRSWLKKRIPIWKRAKLQEDAAEAVREMLKAISYLTGKKTKDPWIVKKG